MTTLTLVTIILLFAFVFFMIAAYGGIRNRAINFDSLGFAFVVLAFIVDKTKLAL